MSTVEQFSETTEQSEYEAHIANYRWFVRLIWWNVAAIAVVLILLAAFFG